MSNMKRLLDVLDDCEEAAAFYKGRNLLLVNERFADIFGRSVDECEGLPIMEICHNDSIEMIGDYIHRRAANDPTVPSVYEAAFRTPDNPKLMLMVNVLEIKKTDGAVLVLLRGRD